jgi:hypothetical protein
MLFSRFTPPNNPKDAATIVALFLVALAVAAIVTSLFNN